MVLPTIAVLIGLVAVAVALLRDAPPPAEGPEVEPPNADDADAEQPAQALSSAVAGAPPVRHREDPDQQALRTEAALQVIEERRL